MAAEPHPYSRPVDAINLRSDGVVVTLRPNLAERAAIAALLDIPSIESVSGEFRLTPKKAGTVNVGGRVKADLHQLCVVSLDPFPVSIEEEVDVDFAPEAPQPKAAPAVAKPQQRPGEMQIDLDDIDPPDLIIDGKIDLGALLCEFVALGLDPFPRKPGVVFDFKDEADIVEHPFAALSKLKPPE